jgi:hypothetical protein
MGQRLIVEGENDIRVIAQFWMSCNLHKVKGYEEKRRFEKEFVKIAGGIEPLKEQLQSILKSDLSDIESIGIIVDADENPLAKWDSIKHILENKGYTNLPSGLPLEGMVIEQVGLPKIGLWVMPDNRLPGYLEHFYESLIKAEDNLKPAVATAIQSLYDQNITRFTEIRRQKAFVHTWLSWQETPGASMGLTMQGKSDLFDFLQPNAQAFLAWSKQVFQFTEE